MTFRENRIHFIGVGGIGMSGIARMLVREGKRVSGSDLRESDTTNLLASEGLRIFIGQDAANLDDDLDLVVVTAAIKPDNPELVEARRRGIPVEKYAEVLGRLMNDRRGIAVSGAAGKTTTTAMLVSILKAAGLDPNFVVGAAVGNLGGSSGVGAGDLFVVEACEYDRSFHNLHPHCAVINNVDEDHLDYYKGGLPEIIESFAQFARQVRPEGRLIINLDDKAARSAARIAGRAAETFSLDNRRADWSVASMHSMGGLYTFRLRHKGQEVGEFEMGIPGKHNVSNALAAIACARWAGVDYDAVRTALRDFHGADRRFQLVGEAGGATIIDDYAHHPTKIRVTLEAAREMFAGRRIWVIFQPHQHSRTRFLLKDFAASFGDADIVLVPDIFFVRDTEEDRQAVTSNDLVREMEQYGRECHYLATFRDIEEHLAERLHEGDVIITMGAGDVYKVGQTVLRRLSGCGRPFEHATV